MPAVNQATVDDALYRTGAHVVKKVVIASTGRHMSAKYCQRGAGVVVWYNNGANGMERR